mgnify:CR=1 FL=1
MKLGGVFVEHLGKLALRLGHNLVFFAALWLAGAVLGLVLPWFLPVICATLGWLALSAYFFTKYEPWFDGWALLLGAVPIVMTAMSAADYVYVSLGTPQPVKSLAQAAQSAPVRVYQLPADMIARPPRTSMSLPMKAEMTLEVSSPTVSPPNTSVWLHPVSAAIGLPSTPRA